jgi:hypothetical protein
MSGLVLGINSAHRNSVAVLVGEQGPNDNTVVVTTAQVRTTHRAAKGAFIASIRTSVPREHWSASRITRTCGAVPNSLSACSTPPFASLSGLAASARNAR